MPKQKENLEQPILDAIKSGAQTVEQIAEKLDKSDGLVRATLKTLIEDKKVEKKPGAVKKPGAGKNGRPSDGYAIVG
jgi:predicted ArsR family transcriptional regulator